jgi:tRNA G18 (ribose-2'-O)-methylase SpoU
MSMQFYLLISNVSKQKNIGMMVRSAGAFGVKEILIVGQPKFTTFGAQGTQKHVKFRHFPSLLEARTFLKGLGCTIYGAEIVEGALSIASHPFKGNAAFVMGNEVTYSKEEASLDSALLYRAQECRVVSKRYATSSFTSLSIRVQLHL